MTLRPLTGADPAQIGPYTLRGRLGIGGMGTVYLGERDGTSAAVKVIRPDLAGDQVFRQRFRREVHAARRVQSPVTAPVLTADADSDPPWVAFAYIQGPTLAEVVAAGLPRLSAAVGILSGVAEALEAIHAAGLVHRDLKPSNVLVPPDGVRVIDFGIATALDQTALTVTSAMIGTPAWLAPEQVQGEPATSSSDVFAWGLLAAYVTTGRHPFGADDLPPHAVMYRLVHEQPTLDGVPAELEEVVTSALSKDPAQRPTAANLRNRLLPRAREAASPTVAAADLPTQVDTASRSSEEAHREGRSRRPDWLWVVTGLVAALLIVGIIYAATRHGAPQTGHTTSNTTAPPPSTTPTTATPAATTISAPADRSPLTLTGPPNGGYTIRLPANWKFRDTSYPSDHATHLWYDPNDPLAKMEVLLSGCAGCAQNPNDPTQPNLAGVMPTDTVGTFTINPRQGGFERYTSDDTYPDNGVIYILPVQGGRPSGYLQVDLWLPDTQHQLATDILNSLRAN